MILNNYIIKHILESILLSTLLLISVFLIFSILGNLGENYTFSNILLLSLISSLQIFIYIPMFVFFLIIIIFIYRLKIKNELLIILHYTPKIKIVFFFLFLIFLFSILELNKNSINIYFENYKNKLSNKENLQDHKLIIEKNKNSKSYTLIKDKYKKFNIANSYFFLSIKNNTVFDVIYSDNISFSKNFLIANNFYKLENNNIKKYDEKLSLISKNILKNDNLSSVFLKDNKKIISDQISFIFEACYVVILLLFILLIFIDKKIITKQKNLKKFLISILFICYVYFIINTNLLNYQVIFNSLGIIFITTVFVKENYD